MAYVESLASTIVSRQQRYPESLAVRCGGDYVVVRLSDVDWIEADGNYARLHIAGRIRVLGRSLGRLEREVLDRDIFVRVHRSAIVNVRRIQTIETGFHGDLLLILVEGSRVPCSRRQRPALAEKLYFTA